MQPAEQPAPAAAGDAGERLLVLAPTGRDAELACQVLGGAGLACSACADEDELCREIAAGAGTVIIAEEALRPWALNRLVDALERQEPWSDLPLIVFAQNGESSENVLASLAPHGNATILERPVRRRTLISAVKACLRARRRQYEVRDLLLRQGEADRRKDEFLALLGHELRNPLAAIRNALFILDKVGSHETIPMQQRKVIGRQAGHLARMVDDLLDVSRVTLGKISLDLQLVDLRHLAERCLSEYGLDMLASNQSLSLASRLETVIVEGDPVRLEQVFCNLLQNAVKYTPRGGNLVVTVRREDGRGVLRVADTGIGIPKDMLPGIFEPFAQVESSRLHSAGGLGLGLPLVRSLVTLHGGTVEARSGGPGRGSEFVVALPLASRRVAAAARRPVPQAAGAGAADGGPEPRAPAAGAQVRRAATPAGLRVLVIEDNLDGRQSLRDLLELWDHEVELAENGPQGIEKALASPPDVALVDIGLPGLDGNEVARRIVAALGPNRVTLIAMTGYGQPDDRRRALEAGFETYLVKPVNPDTLCRLLAELAQRRAAFAAAQR
ncbi:MAG TPA: hybrid sensor histidine kinase/response regulator [Thermoanaerobaculia bacterium]|nr:hybrid sensor histidine kinase/response regulator [Thermoanaerobaculia bacterium]